MDGIFDLDLSYATGYNGGYTVKIRVRTTTYTTDDYAANDEKVFKFNTFYEVFLPMMMED